MTFEKRCFIHLQDISGVELECSHCHTRVLFPFFDLERLSVQCPNCREVFFDPKKGDLELLAELGNKLNAVRKRGLTGIRLHVNLPEEKQP